MIDYGSKVGWNPIRSVNIRMTKNFRKQQIHFGQTSPVETT